MVFIITMLLVVVGFVVQTIRSSNFRKFVMVAMATMCTLAVSFVITGMGVMYVLVYTFERAFG